jgi:hypothetical protein
VGAGFLLVRRSVFVALSLGAATLIDTGAEKPWWLFWPAGAVPRGAGTEYLSEDYGFCHLARRAGFRVWLDRQCRVPHVGQMVFQA